MSHSRARSLFLAGALVAAALVPAAAAGAAPRSKADVARAEHDRIVSYWTPERMRAAKPRDFERMPDGSFRQVKQAKAASARKARPGGGGGSTGSTIASTSGASWTAGGDVAKRTGKVYFRMGGSGYVCSGAVVGDGDTTNSTSLVLTAAHCVYDESKPDGVSGFATDWLFIPDFDAAPNLNTNDCTAAPTRFGCWTATALVAHSGFTRAGGFTTAATRHDFAFAVVGPGGVGGTQLDATVGGYGLSTSVRAKDQLSAFGYPAAGRYNGTDLTYCSGAVSTDPYNGYTGPDDNWRMSCQMTGGSSGGPWLTTGAGLLAPNGSGGEIGSLNSYGYSGIRSMFGPVFNAETLAVFAAAKAATTNTSVG